MRSGIQNTRLKMPRVRVRARVKIEVRVGARVGPRVRARVRMIGSNP